MGVEVVGDRQLGGEVSEPQAGEPGAVSLRPRRGGAFVVDLTAQQELRKAVPGAHQIAADVLPTADQVTQLFVLD